MSNNKATYLIIELLISLNLIRDFKWSDYSDLEIPRLLRLKKSCKKSYQDVEAMNFPYINIVSINRQI